LTDTVRLTIPRDEPYQGVARLVVGGLAARLAFSYEHLEDLKLALDSFLANEAYTAGPELTIELRVREDGIELRAGPVAEAFRLELERDVPESEGVGLGRLLSTVAEGVEIENENGTEWLRLEKRLPGRTVTRA
jgi:anti-sigma regulatory factor (Ser/Thr protein kinase)